MVGRASPNAGSDIRRGYGLRTVRATQSWHQNITSCHVTLTVSKSDPRRVVVPVLYENLIECRPTSEIDNVAPMRVLRWRSGFGIASTRVSPPANQVALTASHDRPGSE